MTPHPVVEDAMGGCGKHYGTHGGNGRKKGLCGVRLGHCLPAPVSLVAIK